MSENGKQSRPLPKAYRDKTLQDDKRFGEALRDLDYITSYQLKRGLSIQQRHLHSGKIVRLSTILIKRDIISFEHAEEAFESIGEPRKFCRTCGTRYRPDTSKLTCSQCNTPYPLSETEAFELIAVDGGNVHDAETLVQERQQNLGKEFGKYLIQERLGQGGMGAVYKAYDTKERIKVALKIMLPWLAEQQEFRDRFLVEISALSKIDHPNAVHLYESGEIDGYLYCAMELLAGVDMKSRLAEEGQFSVHEVVGILWDIAQVLDFGYSKFAPGTFVHRDIKPGNIFSCNDGTYRLMDFGLVRSRVLFEKSITEKGDIFGTVPYMSPEQVRGEKGIDIRSDIFSLGSTAYHLLSGEFPFPGEKIRDIQKAVCRAAAVPIRRLVSEVPKPLADCLKKMMSAKPQHRFRTPAELLDALEPLTTERP